MAKRKKSTFERLTKGPLFDSVTLRLSQMHLFVSK